MLCIIVDCTKIISFDHTTNNTGILIVGIRVKIANVLKICKKNAYMHQMSLLQQTH